ncbi:response regulator transcription factor [Chitinivibrio alkaliphilus]|nr:response regulator [Chitinivibrio alkaliphilus]
MHFLVVEDDFFCRSILVNILNEHGRCDVAVNGSEASLAFASSLEQGTSYDVVFLDIMLPDKDGQTLLKEFRAAEKEHGVRAGMGVPIIMTTALDDRGNILQAFSSQCEGYIVKPVDEDKVAEKLRELRKI